MLLSRVHAVVDLMRIPRNPWWSQLLVPARLSDIQYVVWLRPRGKLILALFLYTNGESFDLLCISELL